MTDRPPYLALRDFHVWFTRRRSFFEALRRSDPGYVRAVDGIELTIGKGEIYCLVGESGCGKTTTGKGILRLVEPTRGDVFLNPTGDELAAYETMRSGGHDAELEELRKKRSLTYVEKAHRRVADWLLLSLLAAGGVIAGALGGTGLVLALRAAGGGGLEPFAYLGIGIPLALVGTLPWGKGSRHVPHLLVGGSIVAAIAAQVLTTYAHLAASGAAADMGSVFAEYSSYMQQNTLFVALAEFGLAAIVTWFASVALVGFWARRRGIETDRLRKLRTRLQIIFQDPYESLNPRHTVYSIVAEPLLVNRVTRSRAETEARVERALQEAGLRPPKEYLLRFPHELSGGQWQRVGIAGALVLDPEFLVADEPVSMLDVSIRTEIIELLLQLRANKDLTYLFITHDLSLAYVLADRIGVMYLGRIVEEGSTQELISNPRHPYTKALISVVPMPDPDRKRERTILRGERPDPSDIPPGCRFHPRCPVAFERCGWTSEELLDALRVLAPGDDARYLKGAAMQGPGKLVWTPTPDGLEPWLRSLIAEKSEEYRALKGIAAIEGKTGSTTAVLHPFEEPVLKPASPDVRVACHLFA